MYRVNSYETAIRIWPAKRAGKDLHTSAVGRFFTSRFTQFWVPSWVAVGLRLPPVEALPIW